MIIANVSVADSGHMAVSVYRDDVYVCDFLAEYTHLADMGKLIGVNVFEFQYQTTPDKISMVKHAIKWVSQNNLNDWNVDGNYLIID